MHLWYTFFTFQHQERNSIRKIQIVHIFTNYNGNKIAKKCTINVFTADYKTCKTFMCHFECPHSTKGNDTN